MKSIKLRLPLACLALMLALCLPAFAQDAYPFGEEPGMRTSVAILAGTLYAATSQGLYAYALADGTTTKQLDIDVLRARPFLRHPALRPGGRDDLAL